MLIAFQAAMDTTVEGVDGTAGSLRDLVFTRASWEIRYLCVAASGLLGPRLVLLSPETVEQADWPHDSLSVRATQEQVRTAPELEGDLPSPREEQELMLHFGWRPYWEGVAPVVTERPPDLWGAEDLTGYDVKARDGDVGYVEDLIFDDNAWLIRYLVVDVGSWLSDRRVLMAREWTGEIDWDSGSVQLGLTKGQIEQAPEFAPEAPVNRQYEHRLYDFYGQPKYWTTTG